MKEALLESPRSTAAGPDTGGTLATRTKQDASRHQQLGLSDRDLLDMYRTMVTARLCDEAQFRLNRQGKAPFVVPVSGHEGCQIGSAWPFEKGKDVFLPYYRDMGICLVAGMTARDVFLGVFGKRDDPSSGGRQMPAHWSSRRLGIVTGSSPIATQIPHAAGVAYAMKLKGEGAVAGCWFGDGATSEGDWHEGLNFSGIHRLPIVWFCENNKYAISVPLSKQMAVKDVAMRAEAYGFEGVVVDGNDVLGCYDASKRAVDKARSGAGRSRVRSTRRSTRPGVLRIPSRRPLSSTCLAARGRGRASSCSKGPCRPRGVRRRRPSLRAKVPNHDREERHPDHSRPPVGFDEGGRPGPDHGRGRGCPGRRFPGHGRLPGRVRRAARHRHPARGVLHRGLRHRDGDAWAPARGRDP